MRRTARTITARHLFLAGMSEQAFPSPERAGRLATEADYRFFARAADQRAAGRDGKRPAAPTRAQEEMLLFYEVLSRAEESLTISYPALDDKAQDLPPSPYVTEIERTIRHEAISRTLASRAAALAGAARCNAVQPAEWRVQAVAQARRQKRDAAIAGRHLSRRAADSRSAQAIDAGLRIIHARARGESFGPAEGLLTSPAVAARLAERFGPSICGAPASGKRTPPARTNSFWRTCSSWSRSATWCWKPITAAAAAWLHDVLATFHRKSATGRPRSGPRCRATKTRFAADLRRTLDEAIARADRRARASTPPCSSSIAGRSKSGSRATASSTRSTTAPGRDSTSRCCRRTSSCASARAAGRRERRRSSIPSTTRFGSISAARQIRVTGRIDRIDVGRVGGKTVFNVIDYKSGAAAYAEAREDRIRRALAACRST